MRPERLAVYTTVYPGVERYLAEWHQSVEQQTDRDFDLWIALDGLEPEAAEAAVGGATGASWLRSGPGATPARIRSDALTRLAREYEGVVMVDSDDVLHPTRVAAARAMLAESDVAACALEVMDEAGRDLGVVLAPPAAADPSQLLSRWNVFGMSNTAWRARTLGAALPVPDECVLVDWLLATRAWAAGASFAFDPTPRMRYRQYAGNVAPMLPPFRPAQVLEATRRVLDHYRLVLDNGRTLPATLRGVLDSERARVAAFAAAVAAPDRLDAYVDELNRLPPERVWWWQVAHPRLEKTWSS